jgi:hypothetical protein
MHLSIPYNMHIQICNQKGPIKKTISNQHMKISLKTPHKPNYSIKDMAVNMHECSVLGKFIIYKLGMSIQKQ